MGGIQAAGKNLLFEGCVPSSQRIEDVLSSQVDDNITVRQPRPAELSPRNSIRARLSGDQLNFVALGFQ